MTAVYTNSMGQNYRAGTVGAAQDAIQLTQLLTWGFVGIQIFGAMVATVTFEATVDGTNFVALPVTPIAGGATVTSATAAGIWYVQNTGFNIIQARVSAYTSGTPTISIRSLPSQV